MGSASQKTPQLIVALIEQARQLAREEAAPRVSPRLAIAVVMAGLIGLGWVARSTRAQNAPKESAPIPPSLNVPDEVKPGASAPAPALPTPIAAPRSPFELDQAVGLPLPGGSDDPEKSAQAFVEQNRKVAEGQLKNLKDEAEKLRARLQKVEAGIRRWEALLAALQKSEAVARDTGAPTDLEPVPNARPKFSARAVPSAPASGSVAPPPQAPAGERPAAAPVSEREPAPR